MVIKFLPEGLEQDKAELIQLYLAIDRFFAFSQIEEIYERLHVDDVQDGASKGKKIRRLLLYISRHGHVSELKEICFQMEPDFQWNKLLLPNENFSTNTSMTEEELGIAIINNLATDDLQQLCFFLGIDFDDIGASYWLEKDVNQLSALELESLQNFGVNVYELTEEQRETALRRLWIDQFIRYVRNRRSLPQVEVIYRYIYSTKHTQSL